MVPTTKPTTDFHRQVVAHAGRTINKNYSLLINENFTSQSNEWTYTNCTANNGLSLVANSSVNYKKSLAIDDFIFSGIFKITDLASRFGIITLGSWASKYLLDLSTKTLNIYTNYNDSSPVKTLDISSITFNLDENYIIKLVRDGWDYELSIVRLKTMESKSVKFSNYDGTTERLYTRANGYFGVGCEVGSVTCNELLLNINNKDCICLFIGDSLTEGDQVINSSRWARRIKNDYFKGNGIVAGFGGDGALAINTKFQNYVALGIKFKYCVVLAGMNNRKDGGLDEFKTNIDNIYNTIISQGAIPIIAINPIPSNGAEYIKQQRDYVLSKGWKTIRFDLALSLNNDGETYNSALFNTDGVHPNSKGDDGMYSEALKTFEVLIN